MNRISQRLFAIYLAAALAFGGMLPLGAVSEQMDVIVTLKLPAGESSADFAAACRERVCEQFSLSSDFTYDTLLCGFHLSLPASMLPMIEALPFVADALPCGSYAPANASEIATAYEDAAAAAREMISASDDIPYTGDGIKIAVIDSGFDVTHPAFASAVTETLDLQKVNVSLGNKRLSVMRYVEHATDFYYNAKIPFRFDYADKDTDVSAKDDHGTHVAGIIGAAPTKSSRMHGIADGAQLLLMKIFENEKSASDHLLVAAMEDALKLGADIVSLSLGRYSGSVRSQIEGMNSLLDKMQDEGCLVICASGNDGSAAKYSSIKEAALPPASYTDFGTVSTPAASNETIAVSSVNAPFSSAYYFKHPATERTFEFTDTNTRAGEFNENFSSLFDGKTMEYVVIPGIGEEADYANVDLNGKIALIQRGTTTFVEKVNIAASHGAVGAIIYNNIEEKEALGLDLTGARIPAISISLRDGETLAAAQDRRLAFSNSFIMLKRSDDVSRLSSFSSMGVTPSLTLKPDLCAVGGNVYSTVPGGEYAVLSGTSMAAPQIAGAAALLLEKLHGEGIRGKDAATIVYNRLMNTAVPIVQENGAEASPRKQGAGLIDIAAALDAEISLRYAVNKKPKAELFDLFGDFIYLDVEVENITDAPLTVSVGASLAVDGYTVIETESGEMAFNTLEAVSDTLSKINMGEQNLNKNAKDFEPLSLTLAPGETKLLPLVLEFDEAYHKSLDEVFTNGHFIDGFVFVTTQKRSYGLPYMGFKGDFAASPVLDLATEGTEPLFGGTYFVVETMDRLEKAETPAVGDVAFSPNGDGLGDILAFHARQLRNTVSSVSTITSETGEVLFYSEAGYAIKSNGLDAVVYDHGWHGGDDVKSRFVFPDGKYTLRVEYILDDRAQQTQTYTYDILLDTKKPVLKELRLDGTVLHIEAEDTGGVKLIKISQSIAKDAFTAETDGGSAAFDLREFQGDTLYYEIVDYALNSFVGKLSLSELRAKAEQSAP